MALLAVCSTALAAAGDTLNVITQRRARQDDGSFALERTRCAWDPARTAIVICDMWNQHWCKGATARVTEMAPRMNRTVADARKRGVLIVHAPSGCMKTYEKHPARERARTAPAAPNVPDFLKRWATNLPAEAGANWPIDQSDGGCDCRPTCKMGHPWRSQIDTIEIAGSDAITDSGVETWNLLAARGIGNIILMGVHTNMCVIGRPFGLRNLKRAGKNVVLMRDMTDTMYNSRSKPFVNHFSGTELIISYIESYVCPTVTSVDILGGQPFRFKDDTRPHAVFLLGEREYRTERSLPAFATGRLVPRGVHCSFIRAESDHDPAGRNVFHGFDVVKTADLLFVSTRRRALKPGQLAMVRAHIEAGKPVAGVRTASHAFHMNGKHPQGYAEMPELDAKVLGGNYHGHHGNEHLPTITIAGGAKGHPILKGVEGFKAGGSLYEAGPLAKGTTALLIGTIPGAAPEPAAWTNTCGKARVFYTPLGHWDDFKNPAFNRLLTNGVFWALNKPVPQMKQK